MIAMNGGELNTVIFWRRNDNFNLKCVEKNLSVISSQRNFLVAIVSGNWVFICSVQGKSEENNNKTHTYPIIQWRGFLNFL